MIEMNRGLDRVMFPELESEPAERRGVFVAIAIGLIGVLILGLLGIGAIVILNRAGGQAHVGAAATWFEAVARQLGGAGAALSPGNGAGAFNLLAVTVLASFLVAALVGYLVARAVTRGNRKRIAALEKYIRNSGSEGGAAPAVDQRTLQTLREQLELRSDQRMDALEAKLMATLRGWMDDVSRNRR